MLKSIRRLLLCAVFALPSWSAAHSDFSGTWTLRTSNSQRVSWSEVYTFEHDSTRAPPSPSTVLAHRRVDATVSSAVFAPAESLGLGVGGYARYPCRATYSSSPKMTTGIIASPR